MHGHRGLPRSDMLSDNRHDLTSLDIAFTSRDRQKSTDSQNLAVHIILLVTGVRRVRDVGRRLGVGEFGESVFEI